MIRQARQALAAELQRQGCPWPVHHCKPDDLAEVPCVVVDRPTVALDVQHHTITAAVLVVGRRDGSVDAQDELDDATDWVMRALAGPDVAVTRAEPALASVAELTYPAYQVSTAQPATTC